MDEKLLDELRKKIPPARPDNFGITAPEFSVAEHCSVNLARKMLNGLVEEGVLVMEKMRDGKSCADVYHRS